MLLCCKFNFDEGCWRSFSVKTGSFDDTELIFPLLTGCPCLMLLLSELPSPAWLAAGWDKLTEDQIHPSDDGWSWRDTLVRRQPTCWWPQVPPSWSTDRSDGAPLSIDCAGDAKVSYTSTHRLELPWCRGAAPSAGAQDGEALHQSHGNAVPIAEWL
jgi:hypothetical protein